MIGLSQDSPSGTNPTPPPAPKPDDSSFPPMQDGEKPSKPEDEKITEELKALGIKEPKTPEVKEPPESPPPDQTEKPKTKKSKVVLGVLALLFMVASIPAAVYLVKQRQEIRKEATEGECDSRFGSCEGLTGRHCRTSDPDKCTIFECDTKRDCWIKREHCGAECDYQSICHEECDIISDGGGIGCNASLSYDNCDNLCTYDSAGSINGLCDCCCVKDNPCIYRKNPITGACENAGYVIGEEWFCGIDTTGGVGFDCLNGYYADANCTITSGNRPCNCGTSSCNSDKLWCITSTPLSCQNLTRDPTGPLNAGDLVDFTCSSAGDGWDHYNFRFTSNLDDSLCTTPPCWQSLPGYENNTSGTVQRQLPSGEGIVNYIFQCQACDTTSCGAWGENNCDVRFTVGSPPCEGECIEIKVYDESWTLISDPDTIEVGQTVYFAVQGNETDCTSGWTKGRFDIDDAGWKETTDRNASGEFYVSHTITSAGTHTVGAMIYCPELDWK